RDVRRQARAHLESGERPHPPGTLHAGARRGAARAARQGLLRQARGPGEETHPGLRRRHAEAAPRDLRDVRDGDHLRRSQVPCYRLTTERVSNAWRWGRGLRRSWRTWYQLPAEVNRASVVAAWVEKYHTERPHSGFAMLPRGSSRRN